MIFEGQGNLRYADEIKKMIYQQEPIECFGLYYLLIGMQLKLQPFTKNHIEQYMQFAIPSYAEETGFKLGISNAESFRQRTTLLINQLIQAAERVNQRRKTNILFNSFVRIEGKMISAAFHCDLHEFLTVLRHKAPSAEYENFPYEYLGNIQQSQALMGFRAVVRKEFKNRAIFRHHIMASSRLLAENGYAYSFGWAINTSAIKAWEKMSPKYLKVTQIIFNGQLVKVYYGVIDTQFLHSPKL